MNTEKSIIKVAESNNLPIVKEDEFKGYSIEELRYKRAMITLKKEFCKAKILHEVEQIKEHSIFGGTRTGKFTQTGAVITKLLSGLNYLDYAMVGMSLFSTGKKVFSLLRGGRKK